MNRMLYCAAITLAATACARTVTHEGTATTPSPVMSLKSDARMATRTPAAAEQVVTFWQDAGPDLWFAKDEAFDKRFRDRFLKLHEAAARGELQDWTATPNGALALVILLDQFPRNSFRGTSRMYETDESARRVADAAIAVGHDRHVPAELRLFFNLPFAHSEDLTDQERSVALARQLGEPNLTRAKHHYDIVKRFGRFPHRNPILGRQMTPEEQVYLDNGGYKG